MLEHVLSEELEELIAAKLGNPTRDPHGDPIPTRDGRIDETPTPRLQALEPGDAGVFVRVSDADPEMLRYLASAGSRPGDALEVIDKQPFDGPAVRPLRRRRARARRHARARPCAWSCPVSPPPPPAAGDALVLPPPSALQRAARARPPARGAAPARPGVRRRDRLRRPRQLRHQHRRRRQVRLPAAVGDPRREPDGDADPEPVGEGRASRRARTCPSCAASASRAPVSWGLWVQAELIAMATDLAEFVGAAIALNLLFGVPLFAAGLITGVVAFGDPRAAAARLPAVRAGDRRAARRHPARLPLRHLLGCDARGVARRLRPGVRRHRLDPPRHRHPRRDGHAARHLPALGADPGPDRAARRRRAALAAALPALDVLDRHGRRRPDQHVDADHRRVAVPRPGLGRRHRSRAPTPGSRSSSGCGRRWPSRSRCWPRASRPRASAPTPARWSCRASSPARSRWRCGGW